MNKIIKHSAHGICYGLGELTRRDAQSGRSREYRPLRTNEIEQLAQNGNTAGDWGQVLVSERFNPKLIRHCRFGGPVRIGDQEELVLEFDGLNLPVGLYDSVIISCDIGANAAIHRAAYLAHTLIGDEAVIHNLGRMLTTLRARFGNGIVLEGEDESARAWLEVCNEGGNRRIAAFAGMLPADAYLWAKYRDEPELLAKLKELTDGRFDRRPGQYSSIGDRTVIRDTHSIVDAAIGSDVYIEGANRLENLTILSDAEEHTRIGEGTELIDGIIGYGCEVGVGVKARRFVLGARAKLQSGARVFHTFLGDNSTISCCEVSNNLLFPAHEQHHNNSFLIAALVQGQSNIAAGATIGSNHNSRANDGEIVAGRGFWPGLCVSLKHPSRFASFTLIAKGHYAAELNVPLPFSLVSNNPRDNTLTVIPAWWMLYNMYALERNAWKFQARDKRIHREQHLEFDCLAPDTVEEMFTALELLERWTGKAYQGQITNDKLQMERHEGEPGRIGKGLLSEQPRVVETLDIVGGGLENSDRPARILKAVAAHQVYREMIHLYAVRALINFMESQGISDPTRLAGELSGERVRRWINMGGQIVAEPDLRRLKERIVSGELNSWDAVHAEYDELWAQYSQTRARHAWAALLDLHELKAGEPNAACWAEWLKQAADIQDRVAELTRASRAKDFTSPMRGMTFDSQAEMDAVLGKLEENTFILQVEQQAKTFRAKIEGLIAALPAHQQPSAKTFSK